MPRSSNSSTISELGTPTALREAPAARVAGVDGCPGGWAVATARIASDGFHDVRLRRLDSLRSIADDLDRGRLTWVAIDVPIGLPADRRVCDRQARRLLGPRRASVFPAPARAVLGAVDYDDARRRSVEATGRSLPVQAFHLLGRIADVDALLDDPRRRNRFVEAHPELAFLRLNGGPIPHPKRTTASRSLRRRLLEKRLGAATVGDVLDARTVPIEDALDALALLSTAAHLLHDSAEVLGGGHDDAGRPVRIAY